MNIGIITHYDVHNHGAVLQLNALVSYLKLLGHDVFALQFDKNYDFFGHDLKKKYNISVSSIPIYLKYLKDNGIAKTLYNFKKRRTLESFKAENNLIGSFYSESNKLDAVIIGSDEVFALHTGPTPVFFGHCLPTENVISYAASFGPTTIEDVDNLHCRNFIASGLKGMRGISVRDENSMNIVRNLIHEEVPIVDDPVLLYGYHTEISKLDKPVDTQYLLVYSYDNRMNSPEEINAIKDYAKSRGLKTLSPGFYHKWCDININTDPVKLLAYFKYASEVITDTFHGSIMSIITESKLAVKTRQDNHFKLNNLLKEYGLSSRIFTDWNMIETTMSPEIDYQAVNKEVERRRKMSADVLHNMLNLCK